MSLTSNSDPTNTLPIYDRLDILDSQIANLRSSILTKDAYAERRNREDDHIRREFNNHRSMTTRIDLNLAAVRTQADELRTTVSRLIPSANKLEANISLLQSDVSRLQKNGEHLQTDVRQLQGDVSSSHVKVTDAVSQFRLDMLVFQHETRHEMRDLGDRMTGIESRMGNMESRMDRVESRLDNMDTRMKISEQVRFNSLAYTAIAPINAVPIVSRDGLLLYPRHFPKTVWQFWCLRRPAQLDRLVELAEFYQLDGYECWSRKPRHDAFMADDVDSSDSDYASGLTLAEAVREYPDAAHQALAATLGLVYSKIQKQVNKESTYSPRPPKRRREEVLPNPSKRRQDEAIPRPSKFQQDDVQSKFSKASSKRNPVKISHTISPAELYKIVTGESFRPKSPTSEGEESAQLGWNVHAPSMVSENTTKMREILASDDPNVVLRAIEQGRIRAMPSQAEKLKIQEAEAEARARDAERSAAESPQPQSRQANDDDDKTLKDDSPDPTEPDTQTREDQKRKVPVITTERD